jgi:putative flippase GtrA
MVSQPVRFIISGLIGNAAFYLLYEGLHQYLHLDSVVCWVVAYLLSILWQMELHARIVYRKKITNYVKTLMATYAAYSLSIV